MLTALPETQQAAESEAQMCAHNQRTLGVGLGESWKEPRRVVTL